MSECTFPETEVLQSKNIHIHYSGQINQSTRLVLQCKKLPNRFSCQQVVESFIVRYNRASFGNLETSGSRFIRRSRRSAVRDVRHPARFKLLFIAQIDWTLIHDIPFCLLYLDWYWVAKLETSHILQSKKTKIYLGRGRCQHRLSVSDRNFDSPALKYSKGMELLLYSWLRFSQLERREH